jgi:hypothetical protein
VTVPSNYNLTGFAKTSQSRSSPSRITIVIHDALRVFQHSRERPVKFRDLQRGNIMKIKTGRYRITVNVEPDGTISIVIEPL